MEKMKFEKVDLVNAGVSQRENCGANRKALFRAKPLILLVGRERIERLTDGYAVRFERGNI